METRIEPFLWPGAWSCTIGAPSGKELQRITGVEQGFPFVSREYFVEILFMGGALARLEDARDPIGVEVDQNLRAWALKKARRQLRRGRPSRRKDR